jgi:type I restriction enzyme M protein
MANPLPLQLNRHQWMVVLAAWLGWGLDIFDGLLFNVVAPNAVPSLLGLTIGSPAAKSATLYWNGVVNSLLLMGWAIGGVAYGWWGWCPWWVTAAPGDRNPGAGPGGFRGQGEWGLQRQPMDQATHNRIVSFLWGIADDVLRDLFKRGKYPDVILPMAVIRRLDAVLEPSKAKVLEAKAKLDAAEIKEQDAALRAAAGHAFYNISPFVLRDLTSRGSEQQLRADFEAYLEGFSDNVQNILENFKFRNHIPTLSRSDSLGTLIGKFLDPQIDLSPTALDNHAMGTVFEELVRRFNEDNNEEAGEHWTPRDAVRLMSNLIFRPIAEQVKSGSYLLYDGACGTGGMLTVADETLRELAEGHGQQVVTHLYGQEINPETYAVCKADMLLKGEGENAENIVGGAEWSTLSHDAFPARVFDFMLSNPPYGKSWKKDLDAMGGKKEMVDPRFQMAHQGEVLSLVTRSSDGQMLFLANMASKMNHDSPLGSRIAQVHNGSSLFTGDAGSGESNIRRWLFEND